MESDKLIWIPILTLECWIQNLLLDPHLFRTSWILVGEILTREEICGSPSGPHRCFLLEYVSVFYVRAFRLSFISTPGSLWIPVPLTKYPLIRNQYIGLYYHI